MTALHYYHSSSALHTLISALHTQEQKPPVTGAGHYQEFPMFVSYILSKVRTYLRYRETVRELSLLSDRELDDLGISRFQIENIARQHAVA
jgi:uncharacterized protein YjiS (DUF1127 family)